MKEMNELHKAIAEHILKHFRPGTAENHDKVIEIDDFVDLWEPKELPRLAEIEYVMVQLGFKNEESRVGFGFYVVNPEKEAV